MIAGVHPPGARVDHPGQLVGVGGLELGQSPVLQDEPRQLVTLLGQLLQHRLGGRRRALGRLGDHRQALLLEEDLADLLGRAQVEPAPGLVVGRLLQLDACARPGPRSGGEQRGVDAHPVALHAREHRDQGHLDLPVEIQQGGLRLQPRPQRLVQAQGHVRILGGIGAGLLQGDLVEGELLGALAGDVLEVDGLLLQVLPRQGIHVVAGGGAVQHIGLQHGVVGDRPPARCRGWPARSCRT